MTQTKSQFYKKTRDFGAEDYDPNLQVGFARLRTMYVCIISKGRTQDFDYSEILISLRQVSNRGIAINTLAEGYVRTVRLVLPCNTTVVSLHFYHLSKVLPEGLQRSFGIYSERCWFLGSIRDLFRIYSGSIGFPDLAKFRVQPSQFDPCRCPYP